MDIKIITRHFPANYGSILQSIATQKAIEKLGHESQIIDYIPKDEYGFRGVLSLLKQKKDWNNNILKKIAYILFRSPGDIIANCKFSRMRKKHLELTPRYNTKEELCEGIESADIYMTGSDQVWGEIAGGGYDDSYLLSFVPDNSVKVAYSASFGKIDFDESTLSQYKQLLSKYKYISVREMDGVSILGQLGVPNMGQVLDPVYMFDAEWWSNFIKKERTDKYVLVYQIHANKEIEEYAKKFAKEKGLKLIRVFPLLHQIMRGGRLAYLPNISQFLAYIKGAEYVVTDSFHGTSFSLIFNTQFINVLAKVNINSRIYSLLKTLGIEDRIVTKKMDFSIADNKIDYSKVNERIDILREKSYSILRTIIEE